VGFYQEVLDFDRTLHERIVIGSQAMSIEVVESGSRAVTLTLIEPDVSRPAGHLEEFLKSHGGTGVQHLAFATGDIVKAVHWARARGVEFLDAPETYYTLLLQRLQPSRHPVEELRRLSVLVDQDHDGQLYQIFTRSVHPRETFFMEIIERVGAQSFGSGNIKSLYQAVELQRGRSGPEL
jgi:4-hydroxymandelate synthase